MKERIRTQKIYTVETCEAFPNYYYVFGDNLVRQGHGGQAIIRDCPNAVGIPTKRYPSLDEAAYFSDQQDEIHKVEKTLARLLLLYERKENYTIIFPEDGLGTGRARLKEKSPQIYKLIDDFLKLHFKLEIMP